MAPLARLADGRGGAARRAAADSLRGRPQGRAAGAIRVEQKTKTRVRAGRGERDRRLRGPDGAVDRPRCARVAPPVRGSADHGGQWPPRDGRSPRTGREGRRGDVAPRSTCSRSAPDQDPGDTRCSNARVTVGIASSDARDDAAGAAAGCRSRSGCRTAGGARSPPRPLSPRCRPASAPPVVTEVGQPGAPALLGQDKFGGGTQLRFAPSLTASGPSTDPDRGERRPPKATASKVGDEIVDDRPRPAQRPDRVERPRVPGDDPGAPAGHGSRDLSLVRFEDGGTVEPPDDGGCRSRTGRSTRSREP